MKSTQPGASHPDAAGPAENVRAAAAPELPERGLVIAVDGPSGSGKSSAARGVAVALGLRYLDTGAMYRALTWWMLEHDIDLADADSIVKHGTRLVLSVGDDPAGQQVIIDDVDVTAPIRTPRVSNAVSQVASIPQIRRHMHDLQRALISRALAASDGIVAEGRDIGTVVAPDADLKVFLTASEQARAERRTAELAAPDVDLTRKEQARRDQLDSAQLQRAPDAVDVDATNLSLGDVVELIVSLAVATRATAKRAPA